MATKPLPVHGVDISHHQSGALDMAGAKSRGLKWLYHKATEGNRFVDSNHNKRRAEARKAGLPFGSYHFARAEKGDAVSEARHFISIAAPLPGDLRPALDLETTEGLSLAELRTWAAQFIAEVERLVGVKPVVYTPYDLGTSVKGCLIWRPRYNDSNTPPVLPYDIWQFSNGVFGVPDHLEGIGHVDLNVMRAGLTVDAMLIPRAKPEPKPIVRLHVAHASLQAGDGIAKRRSDVRKLFARANARGVAWITGTEAFAGIGPALIEIAKQYGYRIHIWREEWVAVRDSLITSDWITGAVPVIESTDGVGRHSDRGIAWVSFRNAELGKITVGSSHFLTKGRKPGDPNNPHNARLVRAIGVWGREEGRGKALVFFHADANAIDRTSDVFRGQPFTTAWDELRRWYDTGHGNIDVIASYDRDGRVKAAYARALDDSEFHLYGDHFLIEAGFDIRTL